MFVARCAYPSSLVGLLFLETFCTRCEIKLEVGSVSPKNTKAVLLKNIGDASLG